MPRSMGEFGFPAFYPVFDKNMWTELEAEDDTEALGHCRLVAAEVEVRLHRRLDVA